MLPSENLKLRSQTNHGHKFMSLFSEEKALKIYAEGRQKLLDRGQIPTTSKWDTYRYLGNAAMSVASSFGPPSVS